MSDRDGISCFENILFQHGYAVEKFLDKELSKKPRLGEIFRPKKLLNAMRYGVFNGGKRIRPFFVLESTVLFNNSLKNTALNVAAALECVHCYSLIHDDLPSIDNDDIRRGRPSLHKKFDEATAILAGNALLTMAFDTIGNNNNVLSLKIKIDLIVSLARSCGLGGMIGGQILDIFKKGKKIFTKDILVMQAMKTGSLLRFACESGAIISNACLHDRNQISEFGKAIGLAFQISDDLLDTSNETLSYKEKKWMQCELKTLIKTAIKTLQPYGKKANTLRSAALFIRDRKY